MTARKFNVESAARGATIVAKARPVENSSNQSVAASDSDSLDALQNLIQAAISSNVLEDDDYELLFCDYDASELDAAEVIERAFADNRIDCGFAGGWEEIRKRLHVAGLGLQMPSKPLNSLIEFRRNVGVGPFSSDLLFKFGEPQEDAVQAYLETACDAFVRSEEGTSVLAEGDFPSHVYQPQGT